MHPVMVFLIIHQAPSSSDSSIDSQGIAPDEIPQFMHPMVPTYLF